MQLRIPFLPSERRKPCAASELFDEDMIFIQGVSCDVVTLQVVQMYVGTRWNRLFCGANRYTTLVHLFSGVDIAGRDLVPDGNVLCEYNLTTVDYIPVSGLHRCDYNQHVVVAMNSQ